MMESACKLSDMCLSLVTTDVQCCKYITIHLLVFLSAITYGQLFVQMG